MSLLTGTDFGAKTALGFDYLRELTFDLMLYYDARGGYSIYWGFVIYLG